MKVIIEGAIRGTVRDVECTGCRSLRLLVADDGLGFSVHTTIIPAGPPIHWHYPEHLEACYCVDGYGILTSLATGEQWDIIPGTIYALDKHDDHLFEPVEHTVLISIFNPPCAGHETHNEKGEYAKH